MNNWTYITQNLVEWSTQGYVSALGFFFWPLIFTGVIGYVYLKQQSLVAATAITLIIFAAFFNALAVSIPPWVTFLHVGVSLVVAVLFIYFFKKRGA